MPKSIGGLRSKNLLACRAGVWTLVVAVFMSACSGRSPSEVESIIARSPDLQKLNELCLQIVRPDDFRLTGKRIGGNVNIAYLAFDYQSDSAFADVKAFYENSLIRDGWRLDAIWEEGRTRLGFIQFQRNGYFVSVEHVSFRNAKFAVGCGIKRE